MGYAYYNPNPAGKSVGDCAVRALSRALGQSWEETFAGLALEGFLRGDLPNADSVWGPYLRGRGFTRRLIPDDGLGACTVADFAREHPEGVYILSMPGRHVVEETIIAIIKIHNICRAQRPRGAVQSDLQRSQWARPTKNCQH